jgi:hypothetical protein
VRSRASNTRSDISQPLDVPPPLQRWSDRETLSLTPQGGYSLEGDAKKPIKAAATIRVTLKTAAGKSGQVRFKK